MKITVLGAGLVGTPMALDLAKESGFDVLVAAAQPLGANALDANLETDLIFPDPLGGIGNLCGLPALSTPCGFTDQNLPVGLQFVAKAGNDLAVIRAARTFQQHTDWHRKHPKIS